MQHTKPILLTAVVTAILFSAIIFSCTKSKPDPCASVTCLNGGACASGYCSCPSGYTGTSCETAFNAAFLGTWTGSNCEGNTSYTITAGATAQDFNLSVPVSFGSCGTITAVLPAIVDYGAGGSGFTTTTLTYYDNCGHYFIISAYGTLNGNTLTIYFTTATSSASGVKCTFTGTK